ncbi:adenosine kinase [Sphingomonas sp. ID0503]|uniref:adenosine kinase n=1 Tax=Sphingomonas sp. ID0503 TaxID=3399691 RepID=UPI003AFAD0FA
MVDVVGIGNAIINVLSHVDDAFIAEQGMALGSMALIDEETAERLYRLSGPTVRVSGGSAGNTIAGIASLGGSAAYIGKVRDDELGDAYRHDMVSAGIRFDTPAATDGPATARCLIFVSGDGQRTMNTYLGACVNLTPEDVDADLIASAKVTYLEGYLFDPPAAKEAFRKAAKIARDAGQQVALSLSDLFCVARYRQEFLELVEHHVDILFGNDAEICALFETDDVDAAIEKLKPLVKTAAITLGAKGSRILSGGETVDVAAAPVARVVDTTGAGDLYAAGFLYGLVNGKSPRECGEIAALAAAEIISHFGARPETPLSAYVRG